MATSESWRLFEPHAFVAAGIAVCRIPLDTSRPLDAAEWATLSPNEVARGERYRFDEPRIRFVRCRRALREILGAAVNQPASALTFSLGVHGKPNLTENNLEFSVSHSAEWGVIAVSPSQPVGVDVERADPRVTYRGLAQRFFSTAEFSALVALPPEQQLTGFYRVWTSKEAFIKALGRGLSFPLRSFTVSADPEQPPRLLDVETEPHCAKGWHAVDVAPADGYAATLMWAGAPQAVHFWHIAC